jgi:hypothetical protein
MRKSIVDLFKNEKSIRDLVDMIFLFVLLKKTTTYTLQESTILFSNFGIHALF